MHADLSATCNIWGHKPCAVIAMSQSFNVVNVIIILLLVKTHQENILRRTVLYQIGLNIFYSSQDMIKDPVEGKAMFSPLQCIKLLENLHFTLG